MSIVRHDHFLSLDQAIMRLETGWYVPHGDDAGFDCHPLPMNEFLRGLDECGDPTTFIDLGCGIGTKVLVAYLRGWEAHGIERHLDYAQAARKLVPEANITNCDVTDILDLTMFDVVYSYRLMVDLDDQQRLNSRIISMMRPGALYFCAGSNPTDEYVEQVCPDSSVWRVK